MTDRRSVKRPSATSCHTEDSDGQLQGLRSDVPARRLRGGRCAWLHRRAGDGREKRSRYAWTSHKQAENGAKTQAVPPAADVGRFHDRAKATARLLPLSN